MANRTSGGSGSNETPSSLSDSDVEALISKVNRISFGDTPGFLTRHHGRIDAYDMNGRRVKNWESNPFEHLSPKEAWKNRHEWPTSQEKRDKAKALANKYNIDLRAEKPNKTTRFLSWTSGEKYTHAVETRLKRTDRRAAARARARAE